MALIDRIRARLTAAQQGGRTISLPAPATLVEIAAAESQIGFRLPDLIKQLYTQIANGGFGPMSGLFGVPSPGAAPDWDLVRAYELLSSDDYYNGGAWPDCLLPAIDCGHEVFLCVDCSDPQHRVIQLAVDDASLEEADFDDDDRQHRPFPEHPCSRMYRLVAPSLEEFLASWLDDEESATKGA